jgi:hypothetical protein
MTLQITADEITRRRAAALAAVMVEGDPGATVGDFLGVVLGSYAAHCGVGVEIPAPTMTTGQRAGRRTNLVAAVSRKDSWVAAAPRGLEDVVHVLRIATRTNLPKLYREAVWRLWDEVCGPHAEIWERTRRAEAAGCAAAA